MSVADQSFHAIAGETLRQSWPIFTAAAGLEVWLVRRIRRARRYPLEGVVFAGGAAAGLAAALWGQSFVATQLVYDSVGEGVRVNLWEDLRLHLWRSWPLLAALGPLLLGLVSHPRSDHVVAALVATAGVLLSWMAAMWLFVNSHHEVVVRVLVLPGGLGVVASVLGVLASLALWMAIGRWIWRRRRRRRSRIASGGSTS